MNRLRFAIDELTYRWQVTVAFLRGLPIFKCPYCHGAGGWVTGYWQLEEEECRHCASAWWELEDLGLEWPIGRLGPLRWVKAKQARMEEDRQEQRERQEFLDLLTRTSTFDSLLGIGEYAGPSRDDSAPEGPTEEG